MKIRFYGRLSETFGSEIHIDPPAGTDTVVKLRNILVEMFPDATDDLRRRSRACVEDSIVGESHRLAGNETVEFFPPLSGG